ncbi:MAG: DUF3857 domain-containing protein [Bacteroidota bacterium]
MTAKKYVSVLVFLLSSIVCLSQNSKTSISEVPDWVVKVQPDYKKVTKANQTSANYFLLLDKQENIAKQQCFTHFAIKLLNNDGVQQLSDIHIDFDPKYQKLVFHQLKIVRNGASIDKLKTHKISVVQREKDLERFVYDGSLTAIINLKDIRVGDIIEYSYSVVGYNPVLNGFYSDVLYLQFGEPVEYLYLRLCAPTNKNLKFLYLNGAPAPKMQLAKNEKVYLWEKHSVDQVHYDINTPPWYDVTPHVSISDYPSWQSVVDWSLKLYSIDDGEKNKLKKMLKEFFEPSGEGFDVVRMIRFIQDEIRYLGFLDGLNSMKPDLPSKVLSQRYGDCKAKSFLLSEALKIYGIEANPVLVNTTFGNSIEEYLPSPLMFNHCIVQIKMKGKTYFVDPTISNQGGDLAHNYTPDYYKGLVIKAGEKALTNIPVSDYTSIRVCETYKLDQIGKDAKLKVTTIYSGMDADRQRNVFAGSDLETVQKEYLDFYSKLYHSVKAINNISIEDKKNKINQFVVNEEYSIDSLWEKVEGKKKISCTFYPLSLNEFVTVAKSPKRSMPYMLKYPVDIEHKTIIELPEEWNAPDDSEVIESDAFKYTYKVRYSNKTITITHTYKTLCPYISEDKVGKYIEQHDKISKDMTYSLTYNNDIANGFSFSWFSGILSLIVLAISIFFALKMYRKYDVPTEIPSSESIPIGGWLILLAIGFTFTPLLITFQLFNTPNYFDSSVISPLFSTSTTVHNLLIGLLMYFELIYNLFFLTLSVLVVFLFYNKRSILPRLAIFYFAISTVFFIIDYLLAHSLAPELYTEQEKLKSIFQIIFRLIISSIWISYFIYSSRVGETFVRTYKKEEQMEVEEVLVDKTSETE